MRLQLPLAPDGIEHELADGGRVVLRPVRAEDAEGLRAGFERLSARSRYLRFNTPVLELSDDWVSRLTDVDHAGHRAWVVFDPDAPPDVPGAPGRGIAVGRLVAVPDEPGAVEAALAVADAYQGRGIGRLLLHVVAGTAVVAGFDRLVANVMAENTAMRNLVRTLGTEIETVVDGPSVRYVVPLGSVAADDDDALPDDVVVHGALYDLLRLAARAAHLPPD